MSNLNIRFATSKDKQAWDAFVYSHPEATPYQLFGWKEAVERAYGHKSCYLIAEEGSKIFGVFPLFLFKISLFSKSIISLPFCDVGDVLSNDDETRRLLFRKAISLASEKNANFLEIRCDRELFFESHDNDFYITTKSDKVRMLLDLPVSSEKLWKGFKSKLRSQARKAEKNGLSFSWGSIDDLDDFYYIFSHNMHDLGSPVHSKRWIKEIVERYGENAKTGLIFYQNKPVGCGIILCTKSTVSIPWASTLRSFNHLAPNMMLYWKFLEYASDSGRKVFDFGRSTLNEGTFRFKKQWGATPIPLYWYNITKNKKKAIFDTTGEKRELVTRLWKKMPVPVANLIGPKLRKHISL